MQQMRLPVHLLPDHCYHKANRLYTYINVPYNCCGLRNDDVLICKQPRLLLCEMTIFDRLLHARKKIPRCVSKNMSYFCYNTLRERMWSGGCPRLQNG
jgi:hypothetical protein